MKLFIVYLAAVCLCFVAVSANVDVLSSSSYIEDNNSLADYEYIAHDLAEADALISWNGINFVIEKALSFYRGVKCTVSEAHQIENACVTFIASVKQCGDDLNAKVLKLLTTSQNIVDIACSIIGVNESVCSNNYGYDPNAINTEGQPTEMFNIKTSIDCFFNLLAKTIKLKNEIQSAIHIIKQIPNVPGQTNQCVTTAVQDLVNVFNAFPGNIRYCSSLLKY